MLTIDQNVDGVGDMEGTSYVSASATRIALFIIIMILTKHNALLSYLKVTG